jgi:hypothetical protein
MAAKKSNETREEEFAVVFSKNMSKEEIAGNQYITTLLKQRAEKELAAKERDQEMKTMQESAIHFIKTYGSTLRIYKMVIAEGTKRKTKEEKEEMEAKNLQGEPAQTPSSEPPHKDESYARLAGGMEQGGP